METTLKHAGDVVFSDVDLPLPMKLVALAAVCWLYLAPVWLVVEARRGKVARSVAIYLTGVTLGTLMFTVQSGTMGQSFAERVPVWARHIWLETFVSAGVLTLVAIILGRISVRLWARRPSIG